MVIGAEHDHDAVEAAVALVQVVGAVGSEVRPLAVAADERPVAVVAEVGRAQPGRAVGLEDVAAVAQPLERGVHRAAVVQLALVEVDVEHDTELGQRRPDLDEHELDAVAVEDGLLLVVGQRRARRDCASTTALAMSSMYAPA